MFDVKAIKQQLQYSFVKQSSALWDHLSYKLLTGLAITNLLLLSSDKETLFHDKITGRSHISRFFALFTEKKYVW